jgi:pimeloyl-ACP methyl ester carboxylesterase
MLSAELQSECDTFHYLSRVRIPVLMLSGRYDTIFPWEASQIPYFRGLGTPADEKRHVLFETGHFIPTGRTVDYARAWLDQHLGPVTRSALEVQQENNL